MEATIQTQFGTKVAERMRMIPNFEYMHSVEKARNSTIDNVK